MVVAPSLGLNDATMIESARYEPACHSPPYQTIMTLIFPFSSVFMASPILLETTLTVPLASCHSAAPAKVIKYFHKKIAKNTQTITKSTLPKDRLRLGLSISEYDL